MSQPNRRELEPLQTNDTATILVGTALWAIALIVLLIVQPDAAHRWWIWTCVVGVGGGLFGLVYVRRARRPRETAEHSTPSRSEPSRPEPPRSESSRLEPPRSEPSQAKDSARDGTR